MSPLYVEYVGYEIDFGMMATETSFNVWDSISYRIPSTSKVTALQIIHTNAKRRKITLFIVSSLFVNIFSNKFKLDGVFQVPGKGCSPLLLVGHVK